MKTLDIVTFVVLFAFAICALHHIRNLKVYAFRKSLLDIVFDYSDIGSIEQKRKVFHSVSYRKMLYQFWKPLRLEAWYTKEQIEILNPFKIQQP